MKSYKEINDEIEVDEQLKRQTMEKMNTPKPKRFMEWKQAALAAGAAVILILMVVGGAGEEANEKIMSESLTLTKENSNQYHTQSLETYIAAKEQNKTKFHSALDAAGIWEEMTMKEINEFEQLFPALQDVDVPQGYRILNRDFQMYIGEENKRYPDIHYGIGSEKGEDGMVDISIQNEQIPQCLVIEDDQEKKYRGYQLAIYENAEDQSYTAIAYKDGYRYEISSWKISKEEYFQLVESVLR